MGEKPIGCLSPRPQLGTRPTPQACALTENRTCDLSVCGTMPNPLSPPVRSGSFLSMGAREGHKEGSMCFGGRRGPWEELRGGHSHYPLTTDLGWNAGGLGPYELSAPVLSE